MNNQEMKHIWDKRKTQRKLTPISAIKFYCKEFCCVGDTKSWNECELKNCPLYAYRLGKRPTSIPIPHKEKNSSENSEKGIGFEGNNTKLNGGVSDGR